MNTQTIELDLSKGLGGTVVRVGQGDSGGTTVKALIYDQGASVDLTGYTAYLEVLLPNKRNYYRESASVSGNVVTVVLDEAKLCSVSGYTDEAYFTFEKSGEKYSTERFAFDILRNAKDGHQPAQDWDNAIDEIVERGTAAVEAAETATGSANDAAAAATSAAETAATAATAANDAASTATDAASTANSAADTANAAATTANTATDNANSATTAANTAASKANQAATTASTAASNANAATTATEAATASANDAAAAATSAAETAATAATAANDAAIRALAVVGAASSGGDSSDVDSSELEQLKADNYTLARALAEATDDYIVIDEICFVPSSRVASLSDEVLALSDSAYADEVLTLV